MNFILMFMHFDGKAYQVNTLLEKHESDWVNKTTLTKRKQQFINNVLITNDVVQIPNIESSGRPKKLFIPQVVEKPLKTHFYNRNMKLQETPDNQIGALCHKPMACNGEIA